MVRLLTPPTNAVGGPSETPSKKNSTVPAAALGVTVAVKVMFSLSHDGLLLEVTVVVVAVWAATFNEEKASNRIAINGMILRKTRLILTAVGVIYSLGCLFIDTLKYYTGSAIFTTKGELIRGDALYL